MTLFGTSQVEGGPTVGTADLARRSACDHPTSSVSTAGPQVDHPFARCNHPQVIFHDDDRISSGYQMLELRHQPVDIRCMQTRRRFVKDIEPVSALRTLQLSRQFVALRLACAAASRPMQ